MADIKVVPLFGNFGFGWLVASTDNRVDSGGSSCGDGVGTVVSSSHSSFCSFAQHFQPSMAHPTRSSPTPKCSLRHVEAQ